MFVRLFNLVLVAAIIACPMRCVDGKCCSAQCSMGNSLEADAPCCPRCAANSANNDRQHEYSENGQTKNDHHGPSPVPCGATCQGVCGGAVFEKSDTFNLQTTVTLLPLNEDQVTPALAQPFSSKKFELSTHCGKNIGRLLRIEQMSFVC